MMPKISIDLQKIKENTRVLSNIFPSMKLAGVTKGVCGDPHVAKAMMDGGAQQIADSRIINIKRMKQSGIDTHFLLLRSPMISMAGDVVRWADSSLVSDIDTIRSLGNAAVEQKKEHGIIVMIDLGDRREGVLPENVNNTVEKIIDVKGAFIEGIGTNLACYGGVIPTMEKMQKLSNVANELEEKFGFSLSVVSGGNSANIPLMMEKGHPERVNHMRLGESILLGVETVGRTPIPGASQDAFTVYGELVEVQRKPSVPDGKIGQDAFGGVPEFEDRGIINMGLLALGRQDMDPESLHPLEENIRILGANSDYTILELPAGKKTSEKLGFRPGYGTLLQAMTSPYVEKVYV